LKRTLALGLACGLALGLDAQEDPARLQRRLSEVQARLAQVDQQLGALKKRRKGVLVELQGISLQADRARAQAEGARLRQDETRSEVQRITQRKQDIHQRIAQLRAEVRRQVRWMQALGPWGGLGFFPSLTDFQDFLVKGRYLAYWRQRQRRRLDQVQSLQRDLALREQELQAALQRLAQEEREAAQLQATLRLSEERLQGFLDGLRQDESRQKAVQSELAEEALQLERMLAGLLGKARPDAFEARTSFASLRGQLPRPVEGSLAQGFGEHLHPRFRTKTVQSGVLVATDGGAPVHAVAEGRVVFAESYQSYGPMVILDHGGGYFTLYTHLRAFQVSKGAAVHPGQQIGNAGDTLEGPRLGFEVRLQAQPQDPQKWLKQRYR
jgi:septal ring factor EnvC (AmiA/AmiB activator)